MKYFADYMKERVYAVFDDGIAIGRDIHGQWRFKPDRVPWLSEENGVGSYVEEMTKEEFHSFGQSWIFGGLRDDAKEKHTWRNYKHSV